MELDYTDMRLGSSGWEVAPHVLDKIIDSVREKIQHELPTCFWCFKPAKYIAEWSYCCGYEDDVEYSEPVCEEHVNPDHFIWDSYLYWGDYKELKNGTEIL